MSGVAAAAAAPRGTYTLVPPEGVPIHLALAPVGLRFAAQTVDFLLTGLAAGSLVVILAVSEIVTFELLGAVFALLFLFVRAPYYVLTELFWVGRTAGKRWLGLRVIAADGRALTPTATVLRNFLKEAEVFLPATALLIIQGVSLVPGIAALLWTALVLIIPFCNRRRQRLGDLIAGTVVVTEPETRLLPELTASGTADFVFASHQLDHYGAFELQTLEQILRAPEGVEGTAEATRRKETLEAVVAQIQARIGHTDPVEPSECRRFLEAFYAAQRAHLEARQLMGERRADKHHSKPEAPADHHAKGSQNPADFQQQESKP
ncbi:MAG: RDD family protein [Pseudomonadota bacterium]